MVKTKEWAQRSTGSRKDDNTLASQLDGYHTPRIAVEALVEFLPNITYSSFSTKQNKIINRNYRMPELWWEPANGYNRISRPLQELTDIPTWRTDIHKWSRHTGDIIDFTAIGKRPRHLSDSRLGIITNPPFKRGMDFVESGLSCLRRGEMLALLLRTQFLEGRKRKLLYDKNPPTCMAVFSYRLPRMHRFGYKSTEKQAPSVLSFSWFIWIKGNVDKPYIHWL